MFKRAFRRKINTKAKTTFIQLKWRHNCPCDFCIYYIILYYGKYNIGILVIIINPNPEAVLHKGAMAVVKYPLIADCRPWKERQEGGSQWTVPVFSGDNDLKQTLWVTWWIVSSWPIVSVSKGKVVRMMRLTLPQCVGLEHGLPIIKKKIDHQKTSCKTVFRSAGKENPQFE